MADQNMPIGRIPPQNVQAEQAVLSTCLNSEDALGVVTSILVPEDFYRPDHRLIFQAVIELFIQRSPIDIITVSEHLETKGDLDKVGGTIYISQLADLPVLQSNAAEYAGIVRQKSKLRNLISAIDEVTKLSYEGEQEANNLVDLAISRLTDLRDDQSNEQGFERIYEILRRTLQEISDISKGKKEKRAIKSGFLLLDRALGGFRPGTLTIVAARPAMGKSAFVINIATNTATMYNTPVAFFSLEMSKQEIGNRILSSKSSVSTYALQNAEIKTDEDWANISKAISILSPAPFYIDDRSGINTVEMMAKCRQLKNNNQLGIIIIDYLQLMSAAGSRNQGNRQQEISEISRSLKIMAKELDVPVIALSQLSRGAEFREDKRPLLADLRDSGAIEQDADMVMFIYRGAYYESVDKESMGGAEVEDAEIIIAKNRQGATKTVLLKWWAKKTLFFEPEMQGEPMPPYESSQSPSSGFAESLANATPTYASPFPPTQLEAPSILEQELFVPDDSLPEAPPDMASSVYFDPDLQNIGDDFTETSEDVF